MNATTDRTARCRNRMSMSGAFLIAFACLAATLRTARAVDFAVTTGDWHDPNSWSPVGVPLSTDTVLIKVSGRTAVVTQPGAAAASCYVGYNEDAICNLDIQSGSLAVTTLEVPYRGQGNVTQTAGSVSAAHLVIGDLTNSIGSYAQSGGAVNISVRLRMGQGSLGSAGVGTYRLSGDGTLTTPLFAIGYHGGGTVIQEGGLIEGGACSLGDYAGSSGAFTLAGGTFRARTTVGKNANGTFLQSGGTNELSAPSGANALYIADGSTSTSTYTLVEGEILVTNAATVIRVGYVGTGTFLFGTNSASSGTIRETGAGQASLTIRGHSAGRGTFRGFGSVTLTGVVTNNGRVIADGYGADRTLDFSTMGQVLNNVQNTTSNGWFAQDGGKLVLPGVAVGTDDVVNWGEEAGDGTVDLVNSARLAFSGVTGGTLAGALLAPGHSQVAPGLCRQVGIWDFDGVTLGGGTVKLSFRYDDVAAQAEGYVEEDLRIYQFREATWVDVTSSVDTVNKRIDTLAGLPALGQFAIGSLPPGTILTVR